MKKLTCLVLSMVLCMGAAAMAEPVPSKSTADMAVTNEVKTESGVAVAESFVLAPAASTVATEKQTAQCAQMTEEISAATSTGSVVEYFGELKDDTGNTVDLTEVLGTNEPVVNEVVPLVVEEYDSSYGKVTASFSFSTPYQKNEPVVVVIRVVDPVTGEVKQYALQGKGTEDGGIEVEFPPEVMEAVQSGTATMAVVSK